MMLNQLVQSFKNITGRQKRNLNDLNESSKTLNKYLEGNILKYNYKEDAMVEDEDPTKV